MSRALIERAREFRKRPTRGESVLWQALRGRMLGVRIYRQKPIGPFIPDFVCERPPLVIEVDGPVHDEQRERDFERQRFLEGRGYRVVHVTADEAERETESVLARLRAIITEEHESRNHLSGHEKTAPLVSALRNERGARQRG